MKNLCLLSAIFTSLLLNISQASVSMAASSEETNKVVIAIDEWAPYHSKDFKQYGFCTHIMVEAFEVVGITPEVKFMPWARAFEESSFGTAVNATIWGGYSDWIDSHYASDPVCKGEYVLFVRSGLKLDFKQPDTFKGLKLGNLIGEGVPDQLQEMVAKGVLEVESTSSVASIFKMLASKRVDMIAINRTAGLAAMNAYLSKAERSDIMIHPERFRVSFYRLILSRQMKSSSLQLLEKFNAGLDILRSKGRIAEILEAETRGEYEK